MELLNANYTIKKRGIASSDSIFYLMDFYLPLIGSNATFLHLFLMKKSSQNECEGLMSNLVSESQLSYQDFILAKKNLESIGLIKTYENEKKNSVLFALNDPETPKNFFANVILKGLLQNTISKEAFEKIIEKYRNDLDLTGYKEVSAALNDSFNLVFDYGEVLKDDKIELEGRSRNTLKDNFSDVKLFNTLTKMYSLNASGISDDELESIHRVASLYGLNEVTIANLVGQCLNINASIGYKIDVLKLRKLAQTYAKNFDLPSTKKQNKKTYIDSNSDIATQINMYESTSPRMFLKSKQNNIEIVDADKKIIDYLAFEMNFTDGMINALLDYVLKVSNGDLNRNYIMKVASTLVRKGAHDTLSLMELLKQNEIKKAKLSGKKPVEEVTPVNDSKDSLKGEEKAINEKKEVLVDYGQYDDF